MASNCRIYAYSALSICKYPPWQKAVHSPHFQARHVTKDTMPIITFVARVSDGMLLVRARLPPLLFLAPARLAFECLAWLVCTARVVTRLSLQTHSLAQVASMESVGDANGNLDTYKQQGKQVMKRLDHRSPSKCSIESGSYTFQCVVVTTMWLLGMLL